jgi:type I restriction enzyme S subunit
VTETAVKGGRLFAADSLIVATSATIGEHALVTVPFLANQRFACLSRRGTFVDQLDPMFAYYHCFKLDEWCRGNTTTSSFSTVEMSGFKRFRIPVPPLEVQREIVRVLDLFQSLEAELEAELEARRSQYEVFQELRFNFSNGIEVKWTEIGQACSTFSGTFVKKTEQEDYYPYPVFNGGSSATGFYSDYNSPENSIAISARGSIGAVNWVPTKFWAGNSCHVVLATDPRLNNRFLYHYLKFHEPSLFALRAVGTIPALNLKPLLKFAIPMPPLEFQAQISMELDKYESLLYGTSDGLSAELAARRSQYEYYRDRLLTFEEVA